MTPEHFIQHEKAKYEIFDWILHLVPPNSGGSDLSRLPSVIDEELFRVGITAGSPIEKLRALYEKSDWARDTFSLVMNRIPETVREQLASSGTIAAAAISEADFNGYVCKCEGGYAIIVPNGALLLTSFAAELYGMTSSLRLQQTLIIGDKLISGTPERLSDYYRRLFRIVKANKALRVAYPGRAGRELQILFNRYSDLGVSDPPDLIIEQGMLPPLFDPHRPGHPLEVGNHLRQLALRFLLHHECAHILLNHFDKSGAQSATSQELAADLCAFEIGVQYTKSKFAAAASVMGAWLIFSIARRLETLDQRRSSSTHPPADERLDQLWGFVRNTNLLGKPAKRLVLACLEEAQARDVELVRAADRFHLLDPSRSNTLLQFVDWCIKHKKPGVFLDQTPRWLFQGAPSRLCRSLAVARVALEKTVKENPDDENSKSVLEDLMRIFQAAEKHVSSVLKNLLGDAYWAETNK